MRENTNLQGLKGNDMADTKHIKIIIKKYIEKLYDKFNVMDQVENYFKNK